MTGTGHRRCEPARPPRNALRRFTFVRHHDTSMASFRPALTEARWRIPPPASRPVNSGPRPCLFDDGFPLSGLQVRTYTSDLNVRAQHTRSGPPSGRASTTTAASPREASRHCQPLDLESSVTPRCDDRLRSSAIGHTKPRARLPATVPVCRDATELSHTDFGIVAGPETGSQLWLQVIADSKEQLDTPRSPSSPA